MSYLSDTELINEIKSGRIYINPSPVIASASDHAYLYTKDSLVQPCSIDLRIGLIFVPGVGKDEPGGASTGKSSHSLATGQTALLTTYEELGLDSSISAIGFPPSRIASQGIIMLNPGHVDPGYRGRLKFTVINMGKEPYLLRQGEIIFTVLFSRLAQPADANFSVRSGPSQSSAPSQEALNLLTPDFLDIQNRIKKEIERSEFWVKRWAVPAGIATTVLGFIATQVPSCSRLPTIEKRLERLDALDREMQVLKGNLEFDRVRDRVDRLERQLQNQPLTPAQGGAVTTRPSTASSPPSQSPVQGGKNP